MDARFPLSSPTGLLAPGVGRSPRSLADLPALGVGLTYSSGLDPLLEREPELVDLLEIEPQTHWLQPEPDATSYRADRETLARLAALPCAKLVHGIGNPIGGSRGPELRQLALFARAARELGAAWASEHLSFNRAAGRGGRVFHTGFLLPPRQTPAGAAAAAASVRTMAAALDVPFAFETGVSYLRPRADELSDGAFVRAVAEEADCGILLDLHNVWTNARNGRQGVEEFLAELPLERVIEIHLAGGEERRGFWVDSHSGAIPAAVLALARELVPRLPHLKALVFELFPSYVPVVGLDLVRREVERLRALWETRDSAVRPAPAPRPAALLPSAGGDARGFEDARGWEDALGALVVGRRRAGALSSELAGDPGIGVVRELLGEFRASMIASTLPLTVRLLLLVRGADGLLELFERHAAASTPELFASTEAERFAALLDGLELDVPYLGDVLAYERAALRANLLGETVVVPFQHDPLVVLRSLGEGRLPDAPRSGTFEVELAV